MVLYWRPVPAYRDGRQTSAGSKLTMCAMRALLDRAPEVLDDEPGIPLQGVTLRWSSGLSTRLRSPVSGATCRVHART